MLYTWQTDTLYVLHVVCVVAHTNRVGMAEACCAACAGGHVCAGLRSAAVQPLSMSPNVQYVQCALLISVRGGGEECSWFLRLCALQVYGDACG
jgi:hypothetical protein